MKTFRKSFLEFRNNIFKNKIFRTLFSKYNFWNRISKRYTMYFQNKKNWN